MYRYSLLLLASCTLFAQTAVTKPDAPPLDTGVRLRWLATSTAGPASLAAGVVSAAWGTAFDSPKEYDTHWRGFAQRYGLRLTGVAASNTMEAGLGAIWHEDPRYFRHSGQPFSKRVLGVIRDSFLSRDSSGRMRPAYARYIAAPGSNFLSNAWRPDSQATTGNALLRTGYAFLGRMASNAFAEFWPDARERLF